MIGSIFQNALYALLTLILLHKWRLLGVLSIKPLVRLVGDLQRTHPLVLHLVNGVSRLLNVLETSLHMYKVVDILRLFLLLHRLVVPLQGGQIEFEMALLVARRPRDGGIFNDCSLLRLCLDQQCIFVDEEFLSRLTEFDRRSSLRSKRLNSIRLFIVF